MDISCSSPAWSPDGMKIAYVSDQALDGSNAPLPISNVWIINADGSNPTPVTKFTTASAGYPAWSPDGSKMAFVYASGVSNFLVSNIWVINPDGSGAMPLTQLTADGANSLSPQWRP
jgi:Tol biopolymer transport system component